MESLGFVFTITNISSVIGKADLKPAGRWFECQMQQKNQQYEFDSLWYHESDKQNYDNF